MEISFSESWVMSLKSQFSSCWFPDSKLDGFQRHVPMPNSGPGVGKDGQGIGCGEPTRRILCT
jgi:hypothetical protein